MSNQFKIGKSVKRILHASLLFLFFYSESNSQDPYYNNWLNNVIKLKDHSDVNSFKEIKLSKIEASNLGLITTFPYDHWSSIEIKSTDFKVIRSGGTDTSDLWLVTINQMHPIDKYQIGGGECSGGWDEYNEKLCGCDYKRAIQENDSIFTIQKIRQCLKVDKPIKWTGPIELTVLEKWKIQIDKSQKIIERR